MTAAGDALNHNPYMTPGLRILSLQSGVLSGIQNMALDEALLEAVRAQSEPILIVRTYCWAEPTLSLGVNQQVRDIRFLLEFYRKQAASGQQHGAMQAMPSDSPTEGKSIQAVVRRPTGGRAILHGEDISYSFITNDPAVLKRSLKESYGIYADIVREALQRLALTVLSADDAGERDYLRSPVCFETHMPSDLLGQDGKKLTGSAQLRRVGGLLQHGAAFLAPFSITDDAFSQALFDATAQAFGQPVAPFSPELLAGFETQYQALQEDYARVSGEILANVSTISGSHLAPASF
jgi:lipoate-protein ligase A